MTRFAHALVVGGSGMLAGCCRALLSISDKVSVLARDERRIRAIAPAIHPVLCDYKDEDAFAAAFAALDPPDLVVAWIHGRHPELRRMLAERLRPGGCFLQVLGSAHGDPSHPERLAEMAKAAEGLPIIHQAAVLGFVVESGGSRWLTNDEISSGVFAAIQSDLPTSIIGTVEPWTARP
jgi:hypothetical protein